MFLDTNREDWALLAHLRPRVISMEAAFFDLDKTVIAKASVPAFGKTLYQEGLISRRLLLRAAVGHLLYLQLGAGHNKLEKMRRSTLAVIRGWERDRIERIVREALSEVLEPIIYREALDLIEKHQSANRRVVIISSAPMEIVRPLGDFLGVDDCIASRASVDSNGRYTGDLDFYAYGQSKADAIYEMAKEHDIDLSGSYAYSDSHTDMPMLEAVGNPVAVNPDKELMQSARANKWSIKQFSHPMTMRDQRALLRLRLATALLIGAAALTAGSLLATWRLHHRADSIRKDLVKMVPGR
jgi:HAD superfamily hydrolase (TIGR01490 family)